MDDEPGVRRLLCRMLAQGGYGTCEAADGAEALASLRVGLAVDLVLSDAAMPQLNRIQLLEALSVFPSRPTCTPRSHHDNACTIDARTAFSARTGAIVVAPAKK